MGVCPAVSHRGKLLVASPLLVEPVFRKTVIILLEENDDGALGVILNRESEETVERHLPDWGHLAAGSGRIHLGGPVEPAVGVALAPVRPGEDATIPGLRTVDLEAEPDPDMTLVRIYSGYSGWGRGQLDAELEEGSWYLLEAFPDDPFNDPIGQWERVLRRQSGLLAMMATFPDDPEMN